MTIELKKKQPSKRYVNKRKNTYWEKCFKTIMGSNTMSFNIVETNESFWDKKTEFIKLYNQGLKMEEILKEIDITGTQYNKLVKECGDEGTIIPRRKKVLNGEII